MLWTKGTVYWRRDGLPVLVADSETLPCDPIPYSLGKNSSSQYTCKTCGIPHIHQTETATGDARRYKLQPHLHTNPTPIQDRQLAGLNRGWHVRRLRPPCMIVTDGHMSWENGRTEVGRHLRAVHVCQNTKYERGGINDRKKTGCSG